MKLNEFKQYYEPFIVDGAVLFRLKPKNAIIGDVNEQLIYTYISIRDNIDEFVKELNKLDDTESTKEFYYSCREKYNQKLEKGEKDIELAALFVYINKHCFNGLYRVNKKGLFNVPFNKKTNGRSFDEENVREISEFLKNVDIYCQDFEETLKSVKKGDFVFLDSPYAPINPTSFDSYTKEGFTKEEHERLAKIFKKLDKKGAYILLTNHNTELIQELYKEYNIRIIQVRRAINSNANNRVGEEVIITNYE